MRAFEVERSEGPCPSCGSSAGFRDGVCVVCACPSSPRQLRTAAERAKAYGSVGVVIEGPQLAPSGQRGPQPRGTCEGRLEWRADRLRAALAAAVPSLIAMLEQRRQALLSEMLAAGWTRKRICAALDVAPEALKLFDLGAKDYGGEIAGLAPVERAPEGVGRGGDHAGADGGMRRLAELVERVADEDGGPGDGGRIERQQGEGVA